MKGTAMKYHFLDFALLQSIPRKTGGDLGSVYRNLCADRQVPVPVACLLHSLRGLTAGGYITVESSDGFLTVTSTVTLTDKGRDAVTPKGLAKLINEEKATAKKERAFCDTDRPNGEAGSDWTVDSNGFDAILRELCERREVGFPTFEVNDLGDGFAKLTVHHPNDDPAGEYGAEDIEPDSATLSYSASVTGTEEQIAAGLRDLIDTAYLLVTEAPRSRKVALHGGDGSLLISLANAANEQGLVSFRMTVSRIRFNRQRFVGKRDSDLDYAQCGDPIFIHEMGNAADFCLFGVVFDTILYPHLLGEVEFDKLSVIYRNCMG